MSSSYQHCHLFLKLGLLFVLLGMAIPLCIYWHQIIGQIVEWQKIFHDLLAVHIHAISQDPLKHGLALIALSFGYGVFHAIGPGHGKAVIITYLGSHQESLKRGACISLLAALLQSVVAIVLVVVLTMVLSTQFSEVDNYADEITNISYFLVMSLGAFLFITALMQKWSRSHHHSSCGSCSGHHVHQSTAKESWLQSMGVIVSMGIRPCTGAIIVLIYAQLVGTFFYGVLATLVMGLGTGLSIASIALGTQLARNWLESFVNFNHKQGSPGFNPGPWLKMIGGLLIFLLGLSLFQAAIQLNGSHPLI